MPFPTTQDALFASGYEYLRWEHCPICGECVEVWQTPGKRTIAMEPTHNGCAAVRHYLACEPKETRDGRTGSTIQDTAGRDSDFRNDGCINARVGHKNAQDASRGVLPIGRCDDGSPQIKLYGVNDENMIACGWLDGTLAIQFRHGRYHYANVAEDVFIKIRNNPFPNNMFVKLVKNHPELYPWTKVG